MNRIWVGIIVTSIVLFIWGFVVWGGAIPYAEMIWHKPALGDEAGPDLKRHFPVNGTYLFPNPTGQMDQDEKRSQQGPIAFVHMLNVEGRALMDSSIMVKGFLLNLFFILGLAAMFWQFRESLTTYRQRLVLTVWLAVLSALFVNIGDAVWWGIDYPWKLYQAFYTVTSIILTGAILSGFIASPQIKKTVPAKTPDHT